MNNEPSKTHWLQNPNKNYLGHCDLPNGNDVVLTIKSAKWEEVTNPVTRKSDAKRVIRFEEKNDWIKPFICNETNARTIFTSTGEKFMEDCTGKKIKISISKTKVKGQEVDCLRVKDVSQVDLKADFVSNAQIFALKEAIKLSGKTEEDIKKAMGIPFLKSLPASKYEKTMDRLSDLANENN